MHEAKTHLSRLLKQVEEGGRVVISRGGTPVADLVPHERRRLIPGLLKGQIHYDSDTSDDPDPSAHAMAMLQFPQLKQRDPFDSLLVAQAHAERLTLLTADRALLNLGLPFIRDARI